MESLKSITQRIIILLKDNLLFEIAFITVLMSLSPWYILGQNVPIIAHDTFDSYFIWYKVLADSKMLFAGQFAIVPIIMDGLPRLVYGSEFNVLVWLYVFFDPFTACVINLVSMRVVGFIGMYLLLKTHYLTDEKHKIITLGVAVCFAILPFYPPGGLSVSSLPLALYSFLNIRSEKATKIDWLILILIPFYSSIIFSYLFFLSFMFLLWFWDILRKHQFQLRFLGAAVLMGVEYVFIEYRLMLGVFFGEGFISHRIEFALPSTSIQQALTDALNNFILGQYHAPSFHGLVILFAVLFSVLLILFSRYGPAKISFLLLGLASVAGMVGVVLLFGYKSIVGVMYLAISRILLGSFYPLSLIMAIALLGILIAVVYFLTQRYETIHTSIQEDIGTLKMLVFLLIVCVFISLWYGFWSSVLWIPLKEQFSILKTIQLSRVDWLHPLFWYIIFALSLEIISKKLYFRGIEYGKIIALALILLQLVVLLPNSWEGSAAQATNYQQIPYREFYAEDLFKQIKTDIGLPQDSYRIINIGFDPAVSQYNGFYTLDGYFNNYPLAYKHRFRNIIGYELAKNTEIRDYFDNWGSRCYIFTAELGLDFYCTKGRGLSLNNLELNTTAMYEMNVSYVFSAVNITNNAANNLQFIKLYQYPDSAWDIYLYQLI